MSSKINEIRDCLGPCTLLRIARGQKRPLLVDWQKLTPAVMDDPAYIEGFKATDNIGVSLGAASNGLCSIDFDAVDVGEKFIAANPCLAVSLRTTRVRGFNVWVRIAGEFPPPGALRLKADRKTRIGEWRSTGNQTVICGSAMDETKGETKPSVYRRVVKERPVELAFTEIVWPDELRLPWLEEDENRADAAYADLVARHGLPYTLSPRNVITMNDVFFAQKFAVEHQILYDPGEGFFFGYVADQGLWQKQTASSIKVGFADDLKLYADTQNGAGAQIINKRTDGYLSGLVGLLQGVVERRNAFERKPGVIHAGNGMLHLDVEPPGLRSFSADYFSRNACAIPYDPKAECPNFIHGLLESALEPDDISLIQRYAGALLLGGNLAQKILALTGTAGGGKSTLLEIIEYVIGQDNIAQLRTDLLAERFEIGRFVGKSLLTGKDVAGNFLQTPSAYILKSLVGHDQLGVELKNANGDIPMRGDFGVIITCNSRLRVKLDGDAGAWRRRLLLVRYERPRPERPQRDFAGFLLETEGPGILRWMIDGAIQHMQELRDTGDFFLTDRQQGRIDTLLAESDSVREFVKRCVAKRPGNDVSVQELLDAYTAFCDAVGWEPLSVRRVENVLAEAMQDVHRSGRRNDLKRGGKSCRGFSGVEISIPEGPSDDHS